MAAKKIIFLLSSALLLIVAAIYNGYPIVYPDTSTYLASGFELETPADRPITYGLFIRLTSLNGLSLWLTVFCQSLLLAYLIYRILFVLRITNAPFKTFIALLICVFTTCVSWSSSQLIADIFTPMLILVWVLICVDKEASKKQLLFYTILLFFISSMHMSHFVMSVLFSVILLFLRINKQIKHQIPLSKISMIVLASGLSFIVFASSYSKYKHVFFVAKMNENKLLKTILEEQCNTHHFKLCAYKDSLPQTANEFIWDEKSPLTKLGGYTEVKSEFNEIINIAFTNWVYLSKIISSSFKDSYRQLFTYKIGDGNGIFMEGTKLYERITIYIPNERTMYANCKQQNATLFSTNKVNNYFSVLLLVSLLGIAVIVIFKQISFSIKISGIILLVGTFINTFVCASLAPVSDRFGCRVVWLVVFYLILLVMQPKLLKEEKSNKK
jgi:hypothetical protein